MTTYLGNCVDPVVDYGSPFTKCLPTPPFHLRTECVIFEKAKVQIPKNRMGLTLKPETKRTEVAKIDRFTFAY